MQMRRWFTIATLSVLLMAPCGCQGAPDEEPEDDEEATPEETRRTCDAEFVSGRRDRNWYRNNGFGEKLACPQTRTIAVRERQSIRIYWAIAGDQWTEDEAREKIDVAQRWFSRYCISLRVEPVTLQAGESARFTTALATADSQGRADYRNAIGSVYRHLWENRMSRRSRFLLILFVNPFREVVYDTAVVNVSGNFSDIPVILVTSADKTSPHIVTHELIHGLGKGTVRGESGEPPTAIPWVGESPDRDNTWHEGGCDIEMGNASRTNPSEPMNKSDTSPMDWASYFQFLRIARTIR